MLRAAVLFFQGHSSLYWAVMLGIGCLLLLDLWRTVRISKPGMPPVRDGQWPGFGLLLVALLVWGRFATFAWPQQNVDEAQAIAAALTLRHDPRFWLAVDAGSHGPLVAFPLAVVGLVTRRIDFLVTRIVMTALLCGSLWFTFDACARRFGVLAAKMAMLPVAIALSLVRSGDFVSYNGEQPLIFLLALGLWLAERALSSARRGGSRPDQNERVFLASGAVLGLIPWVKLQGVPIAAAASVIVLVAARWRGALWFVAGAVAASTVFLVYIAAIGAVPDFVDGYLLFATRYANRESLDALGLVQKYQHFAPFMIGAVALAPALGGIWVLLFVVTVLAEGREVLRRVDIALCALLFAASEYAVIRPGNPFPHYLFLLVLPIVALTASLLEAALRSPRWGRFTLLGYGTLALVVPTARQLESRTASIDVALPAGDLSPPAADLVRRYSHPGDTLVVWGWMSSYHVATQLPQGVRYSDMWQLWDIERYPSFERTFLADFSSRRPALFLDVASAGLTMFHSADLQGLPRFPRIEMLVRRDYELVGDPAGHRLYVRRDRLAAPSQKK